MNKMNRMYRRKTAVADVEIAGASDEMDVIEEENEEGMVDDLGDDIGEKSQQIKVLISRMAALEHYNALDDIDFVVEAIGKRDYDGSPALDVLPSHDGVGQRRREKVKEYIHCLTCWVEGMDVDDAVAEFKSDEKLLRTIYIHLGEPDEEKTSLALLLIKSLKEKSASPEDSISDISDEEFVGYVYKTILGRNPGDDDLRLRLTQLKRGRTRQEMIKDILESKESSRRMLNMIAESIDTTE